MHGKHAEINSREKSLRRGSWDCVIGSLAKLKKCANRKDRRSFRQVICREFAEMVQDTADMVEIAMNRNKSQMETVPMCGSFAHATAESVWTAEHQRVA